MKELIPQEVVEQKIFLIRGQKVMLDSNLAKLYGVETKYLIRQVRRNMDRFPADFMFQLTRKEFTNLRCHFGTSSWGGIRYLPYVFTENGVAMLSSVLSSKRAIQVNITIMRVFTKLRKILSTHTKLAYKLKELEHRIEKHDEEITAIFEVIRQMMIVEEKPKRQMGFQMD